MTAHINAVVSHSTALVQRKQEIQGNTEAEPQLPRFICGSSGEDGLSKQRNHLRLSETYQVRGALSEINDLVIRLNHMAVPT